MSRVFRQQYTRPIPPAAERVTITKKGKKIAAVRYRGSDGKTITAPVVMKGKGAGQTCRVYSPNWYGRVNGERVTLCTNKTAAELMLAELVKKAEMGQRGISDPFDLQPVRPGLKAGPSASLAACRGPFRFQGRTRRPRAAAGRMGLTGLGADVRLGSGQAILAKLK